MPKSQPRRRAKVRRVTLTPIIPQALIDKHREEEAALLASGGPNRLPTTKAAIPVEDDKPTLAADWPAAALQVALDYPVDRREGSTMCGARFGGASLGLVCTRPQEHTDHLHVAHAGPDAVAWWRGGHGPTCTGPFSDARDCPVHRPVRNDTRGLDDPHAGARPSAFRGPAVTDEQIRRVCHAGTAEGATPMYDNTQPGMPSIMGAGAYDPRVAAQGTQASTIERLGRNSIAPAPPRDVTIAGLLNDLEKQHQEMHAAFNDLASRLAPICYADVPTPGAGPEKPSHPSVVVERLLVFQMSIQVLTTRIHTLHQRLVL